MYTCSWHPTGVDEITGPVQTESLHCSSSTSTDPQLPQSGVGGTFLLDKLYASNPIITLMCPRGIGFQSISQKCKPEQGGRLASIKS